MAQAAIASSFDPDFKSLYDAADMAALLRLPAQPEQLGRLRRDALADVQPFLALLAQQSFSIAGRVSLKTLAADLQANLGEVCEPSLLTSAAVQAWIADMADISTHFAGMLGTSDIGFCIGTHRGCRRYHLDRVPYRLLVTYHGTGTEWIPNSAADFAAYENGAPNEQILRDPSAVQFLDPWDVAIFRGVPHGLLHRSPDDALHGGSLLMRLDDPRFWEDTLSVRR